ncbi:FAD/NAD-binding domain-containing protein [Mycena galopus ATCC 62051]|nr:FAD/NAD-binding domain-containing protein [Mycena galopus ATCC 62051]
MPSIVIIGAGIGGVSFAIALRRQLGFDDFIIYEKASDVGGTWRDNIYPGACSDIPVHLYSLSTDPNPDWPSTHALQPDTYKYWRKLTTKYNLYPRIVFNRLVTSAEWSPEDALYSIETQDIGTGKRFSTTAKIVISAIGILELPKFPDIAGVSSFKGPMFHSARWNAGVELPGKKVAVVGNGPSAAQFVPLISEDPTIEITEFCRSPNWFWPGINKDYSSCWKWTFRHVPGVMKLYRFYLYVVTEMLYAGVFANKFTSSYFTRVADDYIVSTAPKEGVDHLVPKYTLGCKRIIRDTGFLGALHRPNLKLNWDGIQSICEEGIITKKGEKLTFDVLIFATGFTADRYPLRLVGDTNPRTIQDYYDSQGGPKAYMGTTVPGFPNLFMLAGPNTTTGHASVIHTEELQIGYIIQLVKPILDGLVSSMTVTTRATDAYNDLLDKRLSRSVFMDCVSWYRTGGGEGKVSSIFPGPMFLFGWWVRRPKWEDYNVKATTNEWERKVRFEKWMALLGPMYYLDILFGLFVSWISS